jgi:GNAT superfamily N-acetyltransferase
MRSQLEPARRPSQDARALPAQRQAALRRGICLCACQARAGAAEGRSRRGRLFFAVYVGNPQKYSRSTIPQGTRARWLSHARGWYRPRGRRTRKGGKALKNITFSIATEADREAAWTVWHACAQSPETCWNDAYPTPDVLGEDLANGWLYILRQNGAVVGSVTLMPADAIDRQGYPFAPCGQVLMLTRACVAPQKWRQGLGKALLQHAEEHAAGLGIGGLRLLCDVRNAAGLALFASAGYREVCRATLFGDFFSVREKRLPPYAHFDRAGR